MLRIVLTLFLLTYSTSNASGNKNSEERDLGTAVLTGDLSIESGVFGNRNHNEVRNDYGGRIVNNDISKNGTTEAKGRTTGITTRNSPATTTAGTPLSTNAISVDEVQSNNQERASNAHQIGQIRSENTGKYYDTGRKCEDRNENCTAILRAAGGRCDESVFGAALRLQCPAACQLCGVVGEHSAYTNTPSNAYGNSLSEERFHGINGHPRQFIHLRGPFKDLKNRLRQFRVSDFNKTSNLRFPTVNKAETKQPGVFVDLDGGVLYSLYNPFTELFTQNSNFLRQTDGHPLTHDRDRFRQFRGITENQRTYGRGRAVRSFGFDRQRHSHTDRPHRRAEYQSPHQRANRFVHRNEASAENSTFTPVLVRPTVSSSVEADRLRANADAHHFGTLPTFKVVPFPGQQLSVPPRKRDRTDKNAKGKDDNGLDQAVPSKSKTSQKFRVKTKHNRSPKLSGNDKNLSQEKNEKVKSRGEDDFYDFGRGLEPNDGKNPFRAIRLGPQTQRENLIQKRGPDAESRVGHFNDASHVFIGRHENHEYKPQSLGSYSEPISEEGSTFESLESSYGDSEPYRSK